MSKLTDKLQAALGAGALVVGDPRKLVLNPEHYYGVQVFETGIEPANTPGRYVVTYELWIVAPGVDYDAGLEDRLTTGRDAVVELLDAEDGVLSQLLWSKGTRAVHEAGYHGWSFTLTITGTKE